MGIPLEFWEFSLIFSNLDCHRGEKIAWNGGNLSGVFCFREMEGWAVFSESDFLTVALDFAGGFQVGVGVVVEAEKSLVFLKFLK